MSLYLTAANDTHRNALLRGIWGAAKGLGMDSEDVHAMLYRYYGLESLRAASDFQLSQLLDEIRLSKCYTDTKKNRASDKQKKFIADLERKLGWRDDPERLRGFIKKMVKVESIDWITVSQASKVIEGMKKMAARETQKAAGTVAEAALSGSGNNG